MGFMRSAVTPSFEKVLGMNLYFRLFLLLLKKILRPTRLGPLEKSTLHFRCLPTDCDYNLHLTNARYFSFCDLARIAAMMDRGILGKLFAKGITPIVTATNATFFKDIQLFMTFEIQSRVLGWDDRFWIFQHDFIQAGQLKGSVMAKGFFVAKRKVIPFTEIMKISGYDIESPDLPAPAREWSRAVDSLYQNAKESVHNTSL